MTNSTSFPVVTLKAHLALNVRDVSVSMGFYEKMLGIAPSKVRTGYAKFDVQNPPLNLTLNQHAFGDRGALSHLGIQVSSTEDVLAVRDRWIAHGLVTRDEEKTDCCFAIQDKAWVQDPDGNAWEVFVVLQDNLQETTTASTCCVSGHPNSVETSAATEASDTTACAIPSVEPQRSRESSCGCSTATPGPIGISAHRR